MSRYLTKEQKEVLQDIVGTAEPNDIHAQQIKKLLAELKDTALFAELYERLYKQLKNEQK